MIIKKIMTMLIIGRFLTKKFLYINYAVKLKDASAKDVQGFKPMMKIYMSCS